MTAARVAPDATVQRTPTARRQQDDYAHLVPLLAEFADVSTDVVRRRQLREELMAAYWPVVVHIARRYRDRGEPLVDLEQVGALGLLGALDRFRPDREVDFLAFAVPTITGEIRRHFRDRTWSMHVPRRLKDLQTPIRDAVAALTATLHRSPRPSEIAAHLGVTRDEVVEALGAQHAYAPTSLDAPVRADDTELARSELLGEIDPALATVGYRPELRRAIAELPERERTILTLRFFADLTQTQIAARVGLSQMHVSRLLSRTLAELRLRLDTAG